jgi:ribosomal protein S18 acetylase RimI-like enzyme
MYNCVTRYGVLLGLLTMPLSYSHIPNHLLIQKIESINRIQYEHWISAFQPLSELTDNLRFWRTPFNNVLINAVTWSSMDEPETRKEIDRIKEESQKNQFSVSWWVTPTSKPSNLNSLLQEKGFKLLMHCPCMVHDLHEPINFTLPDGVELKQITTQNQFKDYATITTSCFGLDNAMRQQYLDTLLKRGFTENTEYYIAYLDGKPVTTGLILFLENNITTFYDLATLPSARRKGIGTCMTQFWLKRSQERGATMAVLISAPDAKNIYERVGFKTVYYLDIFGFTPEADSSAHDDL